MRYIKNSRHKTFCDKTEEVAAAYYLEWINICPSFHPLAKSDSLFTHCSVLHIC